VGAPTILLSAGEPSGDLHGAAVARELRRRWPGARLYGLGGPLMAAEGVELLAGLDRLAVMGFAEVLKHLPYFYGLYRRMRRELAARGTDLVIPIDYPGFNLRLARTAREGGIPVLYYIAPQVWAWHRSRTRELARSADRLAVVLPFEESLFREAGAHATFVGHPLLDLYEATSTHAEFCARLGLDPGRPILAVFPGSRAQEVSRHLELFGAAAREVCRVDPRVQPVVAGSASLPAEVFAATALPRTSASRELLHHADAALVKSGTTTLEAALALTPMVIAYRMHPLTYRLARRLVEVEHIGLVNLVAGERIAPELIQDAATPESLARALLPLLATGSPERRRALEALAGVRDRLRAADGGGAAARVAELAGELIGGAA
jgi:lipid-A-disaccharide synthase